MNEKVLMRMNKCELCIDMNENECVWKSMDENFIPCNIKTWRMNRPVPTQQIFLPVHHLEKNF